MMRRTKSEGWMHPHPAAIVLYASRQILLLLIPILRALFSLLVQGITDTDVSWGEFVWVDLLALGGMFFLGFLRYRTTRYRIEQNGIRFQNGIFLRKEGYLPFEKITVIITERQFIFRPFGYCTLRFDTDAGDSKETEYEISLHLTKAEELIRRYRRMYPDGGAVERRTRAKWWDIVILSLLFSDSISGILYLSAAVSAVGDFLGADLGVALRENFHRLLVLSNLVSRGIPLIAAWAAYLMLISWGLSVGVHLLATLRFRADRKGEHLSLHSGLLSRYGHLIRVDGIQRVELRQNLLARILKITSVFVRCSGYGKFGSNLPVLLPTGIMRQILPQMSLLLPEFCLSENRLTPKKRYLRRFLFPPIAILAGTLIVFTAAFLLFADWRETLLSFGIAVLLPEIWFLAVRCAAFSHTGMGMRNGMLTLRYVKGFRFYTTVVPKEKITRIGVQQSPFQKRIGGCDLIVNTRSEGKNRIRVKNFSYSELTDYLKEIRYPFVS